MGESLREAVETQARARVRGDDATFASYMTPQALLQLRANGHRPRDFRVVSVDERHGTGESIVRYRGGASLLLRQSWELRDGDWKTIEAATESGAPSFWRRLFARGADAGS